MTPNTQKLVEIEWEVIKMCGRFVGFRSLEELKRFFPIERAACEAISSYNVAPSQEVLAIAKYEGENWLVKFHWGLVPFWAKDISIGNQMINARSESVAEKPSFRNAFRQRRDLIPADGFYEWKGEKGRMPAILKPPAYESWLDPGNQNVVELGKMLKDEIAYEFVCYPVSTQVNSTRNNDPSCIESIE